MSNDASNETNGRVTMAVLGERLQTLIEKNEDLLDKFEEHLNQAHERDRKITVLETKMKDMDNLKTALIVGSLSLIGLLILAVVILARMVIVAV